MTTQDTMNTLRDVKLEYEEKRLTHTCPKCPMRYPHSGALIQHLNKEHPSFVQQTACKIARSGDRLPGLLAEEKYKNTVATCPYCKLDCQTRKKLMMHLETAHKDDNDQEEAPRVKVIRLDGSFVTPGAHETNVVQNLLKAIGTTNGNLTNGAVKADTKAPAKLQYKCFWCDASFRKRGKLMDHIDTLHKHNKQQNQDEAEMLSMDDTNKPLNVRQLTNHRTTMSQMELPGYLKTLPLGTNASSHRSPQPTDTKPSAKNTSSCSFTLAGSLTEKSKPTLQENIVPNKCKFYLGKKDNPLANKPQALEQNASQSRRFSLPNVFEGANTPSSYTFPYRMLSPNPMAVAMQQSYMLNIPPQLINPAQLYTPRMPIMPMMPSSDFLLGHAHSALDQQTSSQHVQFFNRMSAMPQRSPMATPKPKAASESPLDLTKNFMS